jgi:hypothetical protein
MISTAKEASASFLENEEEEDGSFKAKCYERGGRWARPGGEEEEEKTCAMPSTYLRP